MCAYARVCIFLEHKTFLKHILYNCNTHERFTRLQKVYNHLGNEQTNKQVTECEKSILQLKTIEQYNLTTEQYTLKYELLTYLLLT